MIERNRRGLEVVYAESREAIEAVLDRVEVAVGDVPRDLVGRAPRLKWYQQLGTGVDWLLRHPEAVERPFVLTNCSSHHCVVLADHLFAMVLAFARGLPRFFEMKRAGRWDRPTVQDPQGLFELRGRTILVVGLGSIGREIIVRARAFAMRIHGLRADPSKPCEGVERMFGPGQLHEALGTADIVAVSIPHTRATTRMFDAEAFAAMKASAFFFNIGRGGTVDEAALCRALREGQIAGAGLDVFSEEPLPESSPLWQAPNLIMTPHVGGMHERIYESFLEAAFENIERFGAGEPLNNVVDKRAGY